MNGKRTANARPVRLAYLVSHPIQYQAPMLRRIAQDPTIDLTVFFGSDFSVRGYRDEGFGVNVKWDIPLLDGYKHEFLPALRDNQTASVLSPISRGIYSRLRGYRGAPGFDVLWVHGYSTANAMLAMIAAKALGIPVLVRAESWLHDRIRSKVRLAIKRCFFWFLRQIVDGVMPIGTWNADYWSKYLGDSIPQSLMPYAVDNGFFQEQSRMAEAARASLQMDLGLDPARPVILFASKLQERKRCADLVAALQKLVVQGTVDPLPYLLIVGDGEQRARLERQVSDAALEGEVRFCGFRNQSELPRFFDLCSVFVLPSQHEPWGLIVNEAMNASRAVIVSDEVGCQPDLVREGIEGYIVPRGNVNRLAEAIAEILSIPGKANAMGQNALSRISEWSFKEDVEGLRTAIWLASRRLIPDPG